MLPNNYLDRRSPPHITTLVTATAFAAGTMSVILPALPDMAAHFSAEPAVVQLAVSLYLATTAALQIVIGPVSDRYGRRHTMLFFLVMALLATLGAIYAPTIHWLLAARMLQGVAVAGMVISRAAVRDMVGPARAASMIGYVTMGMTLAPMLGPSLSGYFVEQFGWQASFWAIFGFGLFSLLLAWFDWGETSFRPAGSLAAQLGSYPELLISRRFWGYALIAGFCSGSFFALVGGGPFIASDYYGLPPSGNGLVFMVPGLGYLIGNFISGRYAAAMGVNPMMLLGGLVLTSSLMITGLLVWAGIDNLYFFFGSTVFIGVGNGMTLPSAISGFVSVRPHLAGAASGLGGCLQIGIAAGLAALAAAILIPQDGPLMLILIMLASSLLALAFTFFVIGIGGMDDPKGPATPE